MLLPKKYRIGITISFLVCAAAFILFYNLRHTSPGILRKMSMEIVASLDNVINKPLKGLRDVWNRYIFLVGLEENNRRLKETNSRLSGEIIKYRESYLESIRLQNLLKLRESIPFPTIAAKVAAMSRCAMSASQLLPGLILPGQRAMNGTRWPPSQIEPL